MQKPTLCIYGTTRVHVRASVQYTHEHLLRLVFDIIETALKFPRFLSVKNKR